jgi:hypothetical protein
MAEGGIIIILKKKKIRRISRGDFGELSEGICPTRPPPHPCIYILKIDMEDIYIVRLHRLGSMFKIR